MTDTNYTKATLALDGLLDADPKFVEGTDRNMARLMTLSLLAIADELKALRDVLTPDQINA
jgi:hypothetical protein